MDNKWKLQIILLCLLSWEKWLIKNFANFYEITYLHKKVTHLKSISCGEKYILWQLVVNFSEFHQNNKVLEEKIMHLKMSAVIKVHILKVSSKFYQFLAK